MYNILYVDDEPDLLEIGKLFLERSGLFSVDTITSAPEALRVIAEKRFDAIISDYQMTGMDGIEFLKNVRASGNTIPFIIFTGRGREEVVIQAVNEGADFYLQKGGEPVSQFAELSNMVKKAILQGVAEAALRSSEENFRTLVENAPDAIYIQTHNRFVYLNTAAVHLFGASSAEELLDTSTFDRIYPTFHELINKRVRVLTIELKPVELIDEIYVKMDGSPIDVEVTAAPFRYRGENGALTFFRDITKRKQAESELRSAYDQISATERELRRQYREMSENEQKLRQSEARYRNVVEDQTELISRFLPDRTHVFVNEAYCRYFGKSREEIIGHIFIPDIPVEDHEKVKHHLASLTLSHPVESIEHRIIMPDGEVRWQRWNDRAIFDGKGNVSEFQSVGRDITDQRQAEKALKKSSSLLNEVCEMGHIGGWELDVTTKEVLWTRETYRIHEIFEDEKFDLSKAILFYDLPGRSILEKALQRCMEKGEPFDLELPFTSAKGRHLWTRAMGHAVNVGGNVTKLTGTFQDITERKAAEEAMKTFSEDLDHKVLERTSNLDDVNLNLMTEIDIRLNAEKQLSKNLYEKEVLLREVHHRVKNNLQIIISLLNLQSRYITDETNLSAFRESQNRVRAMALVHEKLYQSTDLATIDLDNYIRFLGNNLIQFFGIRGRGITLTMDIHDIFLAIDTAVPFGLMINELISNSLKYAFPGGRKGEISIAIHRQDHTLTILYKDNGIGIPEDFDWRNARSMGLRLITALVDQLDGTIELDRTAGTLFTMVVHEKEQHRS